MGHTLAIVAGLFWMGAGGVLLEISRLLGPTFDKVKTVHPTWRFLTWLAAVTFFVRGVTLLFPGQLIETTGISFVAPVTAMAVLGVTGALLEWVMADRSPPPWTVQAMRLVAVLGKDGPVKFAALNLPVPTVEDLPPPIEDAAPRRRRLAVLIGSAFLILAVAIFLAANSPVSG